MVEAIKRQADRIVQAQVNYDAHGLLQPLAERLASITPDTIDTFSRVRAGMVGLNRGAIPAAPFGGGEQSGLGREGEVITPSGPRTMTPPSRARPGRRRSTPPATTSR